MHDYYYYIKLDKDVKIFGKNKPVFDNFRKRGHLDEESIILLQEITRIEIKPPKDINIWKELFGKNIDFNKFHEKYDKKYKRKVVDDVMWFYVDINEVLCMFFNEQAMGDTKQLGFDTAVVHIGTKDDYYKDMYYCNHWCSFETINHNLIQLYNDDCLNAMQTIPDKSIDCILADLPYGLTANAQDKPIDLGLLWEQYKRIIKDNGVILLFCQGTFYIDLVNSNRKWFKYEYVWDKVLTSNFLNAKKMPLRQHEQIAVFYNKPPTYNPQFVEGKPLHSKDISYKNKELKNNNYGKFSATDDIRKGSTQKYPTSIIRFQKPHPSVAKHRTEKPIELCEWLIKTFTNEGDTVLDNVMGGGSTIIAAMRCNRNAIGIEMDKAIVESTKERIREEMNDERNDFSNNTTSK